MRRRTIGVALALVVSVAATGCVAAAAAAGAGAGIYLTQQGAEGVASEGIAAVATRTRSVLAAEGVQITSGDSQEGGTEREFRGTRGDTEIHVKLETRDAGGTVVRASARKGTAEWDKEYARTLVQRITGG